MSAIAQTLSFQLEPICSHRLPDGSYRMSQTQAAEAVGKSPVNALRFLRSNSIKALLGRDFTDYTPDSIEIEPEPGKRGQSRFNALPLEIVTAYWINQCFQGNKSALALVMALATETLERRFDAAFGITRTEQERNERLSQHNQQLERDLKGALDLEAAAQYELNYVRDWLKQQGLDPWKLPAEDE